jgi:hypothetical protein
LSRCLAMRYCLCAGALQCDTVSPLAHSFSKAKVKILKTHFTRKCLFVCVQRIPTYVGSLYLKNKLYLQRQSRWSFVHETLNEVCVTLYEKNEMGGACGAYGGGETCAQGSGGET